MTTALRSLDDLIAEPVSGPLPEAVTSLLDDAAERTRETLEQAGAPLEFVESNYGAAWRHIAALAARPDLAGRRFVEWGSGAGVVTCIAALAGFDARGIESEAILVRLAQVIAARHAPSTRFLCDSFKPPDAYRGCYDGLAPAIADFATAADVVYAYPWPAEERVIADIFTHLCRPGTLLLTFHGRDTFRLRGLASPDAC